MDEANVARPAQDEVDHRRIVDGRVGVGLHDDRGDAAGRRGARRRGQGLLGLRTGLAGLDPQVDQAGASRAPKQSMICTSADRGLRSWPLATSAIRPSTINRPPGPS